MKLPLRESVSTTHTETFIKQVSRLTLSQVIERVTVTERLSSRDVADARLRKYTVLLEFYPPDEYRSEYEVMPDQIHESLAFNFAGTLKKEIQYEFRLATKVAAQDLAVGSGLKVRGGGNDEEEAEVGGRRGRDDELDNDDGDAGQLKRQAQSHQHEYEADEDVDHVEDLEDFVERQGVVDEERDDDEEGMDVDAGDKAEADAKADMLADTFKTASKYASDFSFDVHGGKSAQFDLEVSWITYRANM
jgi:DNA-directed RNA polymerase I subunit RPA1